MLRHFKFALRSLAKTPANTAFVVLSLALGIGANTAIYSLFDQVLIRPLAVDNPEEVVSLTSKGPRAGRTAPSTAGGNDTIFSYPMFRELEKGQKALKGLAAFRQVEANLAYTGGENGSGGEVAPGSLLLVSGQYFDVVGVHPFRGRLLSPDDDAKRAPSAVISHRYWQTKLGGEAGVLNQKLMVNGQVFTIVGILPPSFTSTTLAVAPEVFVPVSWKALMTPGWDGTHSVADWWLHLIGRLHPGQTREQAAANINVTYAPLLKQDLQLFKGEMSKRFVEQYQKQRLELEPAAQAGGEVRKYLQTPMRLLMATTLLVLLIACANVANLLLARAARRGPEMMVRLAIGAGPRDIFNLMLVEALLFAALGAALALLVGSWVLSAFLPFLTIGGAGIPGLNATLDSRVLVFTLGLSALSGLIFGFFPAWAASRLGISSALRGASGQVTLAGASRVRKGLVSVQVALSLVLLISAAAFTRSLYNITHINAVFDLDRIVAFTLSPELNGYAPARRLALYQQVQDRFSTVPGVASVTSAAIPLLAQTNWGNSIVVEGNTTPEAHSFFNNVGARFAETMGIPIVAGRDFTERDQSSSQRVAIVNEKFVEKYCQGRNPVGLMFGLGWGKNVKLDLQIIGVMKNSPYGSIKDEPYPAYIIPYTQAASVEGMQFFVRVQQGDASKFVPQVRQIMHEIDAMLPIDPVITMRAQADTNSAEDRMILGLALGFAVLATLLAAIGLYGVMAYSVTSRTREIGLRLALGAELSSIRGLVLGEATRLWLIGAAAGLPAAYAIVKYAESLLYGVKITEPVLFVAPVAALALVGFIAAFLPAWRASLVDPLVALRHD